MSIKYIIFTVNFGLPEGRRRSLWIVMPGCTLVPSSQASYYQLSRSESVTHALFREISFFIYANISWDGLRLAKVRGEKLKANDGGTASTAVRCIAYCLEKCTVPRSPPPSIQPPHCIWILIPTVSALVALFLFWQWNWLFWNVSSPGNCPCYLVVKTGFPAVSNDAQNSVRTSRLLCFQNQLGWCRRLDWNYECSCYGSL